EMKGEQFELVIVYDGINDLRLACCPRDAFRDDYSHIPRYRSMQKYLAAGTMKLPAGLLEPTGLAVRNFVFDSSNEALLEEAKEIKTAGPIRKNLEQIATAAAARGDVLLLMTYACYIPGDYTQERFRNQELDYSFRADGQSCGAEMWGKPA